MRIQKDKVVECLWTFFNCIALTQTYLIYCTFQCDARLTTSCELEVCFESAIHYGRVVPVLCLCNGSWILCFEMGVGSELARSAKSAGNGRCTLSGYLLNQSVPPTGLLYVKREYILYVGFKVTIFLLKVPRGSFKLCVDNSRSSQDKQCSCIIADKCPHDVRAVTNACHYYFSWHA